MRDIWKQCKRMACMGAVMFSVFSMANAAEAAEVNMDCVVQTKNADGYCYMRSGPGKGYDVIDNVYDGEVLHITETEVNGRYTWGKTEYGSRTGWVSMRQTIPLDQTMNEAQTGTEVDSDVIVWANNENLYLYAGPGSEHEIIDTISAPMVSIPLHITEEVKMPGEKYYWGKTYYNGQSGWVSMKLVVCSDKEPWNVYVDTGEGGSGCAFRSGPGTNNKKICVIPNGTVVKIIREVTDGKLMWGRTVYNGQEGWVSMRQTSECQ